MLTLILCIVVACSTSETVIPEGYMEECDTGSGCDSGLECVPNPHGPTDGEGTVSYCSSACATDDDCPEGSLDCRTGNIATCMNGFCDYPMFCM